MHSRACQAPTPYRRLTASPCQAAGSHSRQRRCSLASLRDPFTMYSSRIRYFVHHKVRHRLDLETRTSISVQSQKNMIHSSQHAPALARPRLGVRTITLFLLRCIEAAATRNLHRIQSAAGLRLHGEASHLYIPRGSECVCECVCVREVWRMALFFVRRRSPVPSHAGCCDWCASERAEHCLFFVVAGVLHVKRLLPTRKR